MGTDTNQLESIVMERKKFERRRSLHSISRQASGLKELKVYHGQLSHKMKLLLENESIETHEMRRRKSIKIASSFKEYGRFNKADTLTESEGSIDET